MNEVQILMSGDYWHQDFQVALQSLQVPVTLKPFDSLVETINQDQTVSSQDRSYDLIVIAASRRSQYSADSLESVVQHFAPTPVILLLGSWCEGERRSGEPAPGIHRVLWHQWQGRLDRFLQALQEASLAPWMLPRTATDADQILVDVQALQSQVERAVSDSDASFNPDKGPAASKARTEFRSLSDHNGSQDASQQRHAAISALTAQGFETLADAVGCLGWSSDWVEYAEWEARPIRKPGVILLEADSWTDVQNDPVLTSRLERLRDQLHRCPIVLLLNFPREEEVKHAKAYGIREVVSKPFQLTDLEAAMRRAVSQPNKVS